MASIRWWGLWQDCWLSFGHLKVIGWLLPLVFYVCLLVGCVYVYVVYVYVVHASKYPAVPTCAQVYEGQSRMPETFSHSLTYCLETGHKLAILVCLASEILWSDGFHPSTIEFQLCLAFYLGARDSDSNPHVCKANTRPTEPSPQWFWNWLLQSPWQVWGFCPMFGCWCRPKGLLGKDKAWNLSSLLMTLIPSLIGGPQSDKVWCG